MFSIKMLTIFVLVNFGILGIGGVNSFLGAAQEMSCCSRATGSCRTVCSQISIVALGAEAETRETATRSLHEFCSIELTSFWSCVNTTLHEATKNQHWLGRACCHLAQYPICKSVCALAGSREDLSGSCRSSDEPEFFGCLDKREEGERCCNDISNSTCRDVCREIFHKPGKQSSRKLYNSKGCFHDVPKCLKNSDETISAENPGQYLRCCEKASTRGCLEACRKTFYTTTAVRDILDALDEKCKPVLPQSPLWSCLLQSSKEESPRLPLDIGKLTCCSKASNSTCRNLCWRAFQADWGQAWRFLESTCLASGGEDELRRCLEDVDDPCEMGCSGLNYCARYNYRPTTLFRTCSATSDNAAERESGYWSRGGIIRGLTVPVHADPSCPPESLRAASCLLQVRPCESRIHETRLCRDDCLELMASCVDWASVTGPHTASTLCSKLSPSRPNAPCVSLKPFLEDPGDIERALLPSEDISTPCKTNQCPSGQICIVDRNSRISYRCESACSLGEMSRQLVPLKTWIQVPREVDQRLESLAGCHRICQCTSRGLEKCRDLNCFNSDSCWVQDRFVAHRSAFYLGCNPCHCFEGEVTCSRKTCGEIKPPSLPCDCPIHYVPVCGRLGVTFASACLAKCAGMSTNEMEFGSCSSKDPCASSPCHRTEKCVKKRRVCLSPVQKPCKQFECVPLDCEPREDNYGPVCDQENREHQNLCSMIHAGGILGYRGSCLKGCSLRGPVCGINGERYENECAAWAEMTVVDYVGDCVAVGLISDEAASRCGDAVQCPELAEENCIGVTPPGACCPVCGGAARLFYSRKQLDRIFYVMTEEPDKDAVTLESLLNALARQIQVAECSLRGAVTPEGDIFIVAQPTSKKPSALQLRACIAEIEKLVTRISERSPRIVAEVPLGSLTRAEIAHRHVSGSNVKEINFILVFAMSIVTLALVT